MDLHQPHPPYFQIAVDLSPSPAPPDPTRASAVVRDALHKAVLDFEETLQRSHPKQISYTAIPDSPKQGTTVDIAEAGEFPSLSTALACKCPAVLLNDYEFSAVCAVDGMKVAPYDQIYSYKLP
jgi:hypothetical protein